MGGCLSAIGIVLVRESSDFGCYAMTRLDSVLAGRDHGTHRRPVVGVGPGLDCHYEAVSNVRLDDIYGIGYEF